MRFIFVPLSAVVILATPALAAQPSPGPGGTSPMTQEEHRMTGLTGSRVQKPGRLSNGERQFTDAYSRVAWVHAELLEGDWGRATADLQHVRQKLEHIQSTRNLNPQVADRIDALLAKVDTLQLQVMHHDPSAAAGAAMLVASFSTTVSQLAGLDWTGPAGGGAGQ
jgi:hypothetical protein